MDVYTHLKRGHSYGNCSRASLLRNIRPRLPFRWHYDHDTANLPQPTTKPLSKRRNGAGCLPRLSPPRRTSRPSNKNRHRLHRRHHGFMVAVPYRHILAARAVCGVMGFAGQEPPAIRCCGCIGEHIDLPVHAADHALFAHQPHHEGGNASAMQISPATGSSPPRAR